jgi:hypothetical protein
MDFDLYNTYGTDPGFEDVAVETPLDNCCCDGPLDDGQFEPGIDPLWTSEPTEAVVEPWDAPPPEALRPTPTDGAAPIVDLGTPATPLPAGPPHPGAAAIGGNSTPGFTIIDPSTGHEADPTPSSMTIGGNSTPGFTIIDPSTGHEADPTPSSMTIGGPAAPGSTLSVLAGLYGMAAQSGDVVSQVVIDRTITSIQASTGIWAV